MSSREHFQRMIQLLIDRSSPTSRDYYAAQNTISQYHSSKNWVDHHGNSQTDFRNPCVITGPLPDEMLTLKRLTISDR
jgi:hypothetical protein